MLTRRDALTMTLAAAGAAPLTACADTSAADYDEAVARLRAPLPGDADMREFIRYATLAANGHNTQPWRFAIRDGGVGVLPDFAGRTPAVDPDDHHLFVSLGCAVENLVIAAAARGRPGAVEFDGAGDGRIDVDLGRGATRESALFDAIPQRQSTRSEYDGRAVSTDDLRRLEAAASIEGVSVIFITDDARREGVLDYVIAGNSAQVDDPEFIRELRESIRFNPAEALRAGDGLYTGSSGNPSMPGWLGRRMFSMFFTKKAENEKYATHIRSSAGVAVFIGDREDKDHWVRVGRAFQRFALQATALGVRHAHINQPVEVAPVRSEFAQWLGVAGARPDLVVRFGYAPPLPMSLRRPVDAVIAAAA